jgi:hypothetical protein
MIGRVLAVQEMTASNSCRRLAGRPGASPGRRSGCQLLAALQRAVGHHHALGAGSRAAKCVATSSIISPAPTNSTLICAQVLEQLRGQAHGGGGHADASARRSRWRCAPPWPRQSCAGTAGAAWCPACRLRRPRARPASSGPGSAARPAPWSPARRPRGRRGARLAGLPAHRCGAAAAVDAALLGQPATATSSCAFGPATYSSAVAGGHQFCAQPLAQRLQGRARSGAPSVQRSVRVAGGQAEL